MKKVGLLTMHRVFNYGSILQAYATQTIIESLGFICDVIDYQYPNKIHKCGKFDIHQFIGFLLQLKQGFPELRRRKKFRRFYKKYFHLTRYYPTKESLERNPPIEDVYIVGSDQTWNTRHIRMILLSCYLSFLKVKESCLFLVVLQGLVIHPISLLCLKNM